MRNEDEFHGQVIKPKKSKLEDEPLPKKGKKHRKQPLNESLNPSRPIREQEPREMINQDRQQKQRNKILKDLCSILKQHNPKTIQKILEKQNYNMQNAMDVLIDMEPDADIIQSNKPNKNGPSSKNNKSPPPKESPKEQKNLPAADALLNEIFDSQQINGQQFEQLFAEIAEMIKEDQREKGVGMFEINSFVDQCNSIKQMFIVGFQEELSNFEDFEFSQTNPLIAQTQIFIDKITKRQAAFFQKQHQEFPSLDSSNAKSKNIVQKIEAERKRQKMENQQYFVKSVHSNPTQHTFQKSNEMSIFNVDNRIQSQKDMMCLHREFYDVPINDLKFIYKTLAADLNLSREFLIEYYNEKRSQKQYVQSEPLPRKPQPRKIYSRMKYEEIDRDLKHLSYDDLRVEIDHMYKLKQALQMTRAQIKNQKQRGDLDRMINEKLPLIRKMIIASRVLLVKQMSIKDPQYVDLHGYREEQVDPLLDSIIDMIREEFSFNNPKVRARMMRGNGHNTVCLTIMTGKGTHSRGQKSVLKPLVVAWCRRNDFEYDEEADQIKAYVVV